MCGCREKVCWENKLLGYEGLDYVGVGSYGLLRDFFLREMGKYWVIYIRKW